MSKGYIGVTDNDWFEFIKNNNLKKVNFWKKVKSFKSIEKGDLFFFLKKNSKIEKGERKVVGYGIFEEFQMIDMEKVGIYGKKLMDVVI